MKGCFSRSRAKAVTATGGKSPKELGYSFPNEWEPRSGTMMIFPAKYSYGKATKGLRKEFRAIARAIASREPVHVFCTKGDASSCQKRFRDDPNITVHRGDFWIDWARDNAPILLRQNQTGELASAGFRCNGWGKKYWGWRCDTKTRSNIAASMDWPEFSSRLVLEGGAIEIANGIGITTESSVLNRNRTNWPRERVERELKDMLGLDKIIWLEQGLVPDPITDGHVDGIAKWIAKDTVMLHTVADRSVDPANYDICQKAKRELLGHNLKIVELPLARDMVHLNFYIGSGGDTVYVPICGDPAQDDPALEVIRKHYATVVPLVANSIGKAGGGIHCYTQQIPSAAAAAEAAVPH